MEMMKQKLHFWRMRMNDCIEAVKKTSVPMEMFDQVTIRLRALLNTMGEITIDIAKTEEMIAEEGNADADNPVQREDAEPEQH